MKVFYNKTILIDRQMDCPSCGETLNRGEIMYKDEYRGDVICHHCLNDYKKEIISEEGVDGRLLK